MAIAMNVDDRNVCLTKTFLQKLVETPATGRVSKCNDAADIFLAVRIRLGVANFMIVEIFFGPLNVIFDNGIPITLGDVLICLSADKIQPKENDTATNESKVNFLARHSIHCRGECATACPVLLERYEC